MAIVLELYTSKVSESGLDPDRVISQFVPFLSSAVEQMRSKNIVHFDLKPGNILQCSGVWKVTDFDAAEIILDDETQHFSRRGTRGFTDPKILRANGGLATSKTDLYSVGVILYALFTGTSKRAFKEMSQGRYGELVTFIRQEI